MRGTVAKSIRRAVYGRLYSPRERQYVWTSGKTAIVVRGRRAEYRKLKRERQTWIPPTTLRWQGAPDGRRIRLACTRISAVAPTPG